MRLVHSTLVVGFFTLLSRILGLVRDVLMARFLGAGPLNDALITAFKIPNTFRRIFAEGAFNAAFIPLYAHRIEVEKHTQNVQEDTGIEQTPFNEFTPDGVSYEAHVLRGSSVFAQESLSMLFVIVGILVVLFEVTMPWTLNLFGFGLGREPLQENGVFPMNLSAYDLARWGAQITMPYLLLISLMSVFSAILNTRKHFAVAAFSPILLNILLIIVFLVARNAHWDAALLVLYLCAAMTVSGALQLGLMVWACRQIGVKIGLQRPRLNAGMKRLFVLGVPGLIAAGVTHINIMVSHNIATLQEGAPSWLHYADRLYQLPLGIIGIAMGLALLPALSQAWRMNDEKKALGHLNRGLEISLFLTMPATFALFVVPEFFVRGLFEYGAFVSTDTQATALALRTFAVGLPAFVLIKVLTPVFFARENTKTPMRFAVVSAVINLVLGFILFFNFGFVGLAIATSLASWVNVVLLLRALCAQGYFKLDLRLRLRLPRIVIASLIMALFLFYLGQLGSQWMGAHLIFNYLILVCVCVLCLLLYGFFAFALQIFGIDDMKSLLKKSPT